MKYYRKLLNCMEYLEARVHSGEYTDEEYEIYLDMKWFNKNIK
ncbi:hypothetical protein [Paenibacillus sp. FSL H7-0331]|nr:hypothetical protein [Paenibacillus sp. FSL H7-0331]